MKTYPLSLAKEYCSNWTVVNAVREILQNAIDTNNYIISWPAKEYCGNTNTLVVSNRSLDALDASTLLLGVTTKANDKSTIGNFGEGYKIALLVLARNNIDVDLYNKGVLWKPYFAVDNVYCLETLHIEEEPVYKYLHEIRFELKGLSDADKQDIIDSCLQMQGLYEHKYTEYGQILTEKRHANKLYVNGLFVCNTELHYGYNMKPEYLQLERDRQTVSSFDLKWLTKEMWAEVGTTKELAKMLEDEVPDVEFLEHVNSDSLFRYVFNNFTSNHAGKIPVRSQHEINKLIESGANPSTLVVVAGRLYNVLARAAGFQELVTALPKEITVYEIMQTFYNKNKKHMNKYGQVNFRKLIAQSKVWYK